MRGEAEVRIQNSIDQQRGALVADRNTEHDDGRFPERLLRSPFQNDGNVKRGSDDGKVLEEKMNERQLWRADAQSGCDECLSGCGESPKIGQSEQDRLTGAQGKPRNDGRKIAEMEWKVIIERVWVIPPSDKRKGERHQITKREDSCGDALVFI